LYGAFFKPLELSNKPMVNKKIKNTVRLTFLTVLVGIMSFLGIKESAKITKANDVSDIKNLTERETSDDCVLMESEVNDSNNNSFLHVGCNGFF
jgi:hypothetical protein